MASSTMAVPLGPGHVIQIAPTSIQDIQVNEAINSTNDEKDNIQMNSLKEWNMTKGLGNATNPLNSSIHHNELLDDMLGDNSDSSHVSCFLCKNNLSSPRILNCLHVFCENCIDTHLIDNDSDDSIGPFIITCPICEQETSVSFKSAASLACDYVLTNILDMSAIENMTVLCTSCKGKENAVARCSDCANFLCPNCNTAHQFMRCFENHKVIGFDDLKTNCATVPIHKPIFCQLHPTETMKFYCYTCQEPMCNECLLGQHKAPDHQYGRLSDAELGEKEELVNLRSECKLKMSECKQASSQLQNALSTLQLQHDQAKDLITSTVQSYEAILEKCRDNALMELEKLHAERELRVMDTFHNVEKTVEKIEDANRFTSRLLAYGDTTEILSLKSIVAKQLINLIDNTPKLNVELSIEFQTDSNHFEKVIKESFGKFKTESTELDVMSEVKSMCNDVQVSVHNNQNTLNQQIPLGDLLSGDLNSTSHVINHFEAFGKFGKQDMGNLAINATGAMVLPCVPSPGINEVQNMRGLSAGTRFNGGYQSLANSTSPISSLGDDLKGDMQNLIGGGINGVLERSNYAHPRSTNNTKQTPMQIRCKFGQLGPNQGQFNSPHGFCLGSDEDIIVADTNNHRIQIFDKTGQFKSQFGIPGKEEGQLWYPRKVAVMRKCGKFVVCDRGNERSRMQIFTKNGHFIKRIAIRYIDIVAGLAVNSRGHIVAVDSVSPTVFVIDDAGNLLNWFDCSDYMREPSDIAIHGKEFFVCDFKGHCVVVFNEEGHFLRRIGSEDITNFPNGIDISDAGDVLIGDSHGNRFHLAVFSRDGSLISEFDCPYVKVSRCCGLKITSEGYIVTLAKNNHHVLVLNTLYIM